MRFWAIALALAGLGAFMLFSGCSQPGAGQDPESVETVASGLELPWALDFLPDGTMVFTERPGRIRLVRNGELLPEPAATIEVATVGESGLLGLAVDPDFSSTKAIFVYYTYFKTEEGHQKMYNRVSRFTLENDRAVDERIILDGIPGGRGDQGFHNGGRIKFGPDGMLYITTGDGGVPEDAQNINSLGGKILRISKDGSVPPGNPFPASPVYSFGHRNPQGLAWLPAPGIQPSASGTGNWLLYASEHGPVGNDELNLIQPGKNYTWPILQCADAGDPAVLCFTETIAPSGMEFFGRDLYLSGLRGTQVRKISFGADGKPSSQEIFLMGYGRIRDVVLHEGYLYILTSNRDGRALLTDPSDDRILRVRPAR
ncbi:MAG: PQQ-dependent sugar dehydrogenase [Candidatus Micrarchaeota archaeon]